MTFEVVTFGCRLNIYESEQIRKAASNAGVSDAIIVNSCAVTKEAERKLGQYLRKAHTQNPDKKIIITGCAAQINPEKYAKFKGVTKVIGNAYKMQDWAYSDSASESDSGSTSEPIDQEQKAQIHTSDIMQETTIPIAPVTEFEGKSRAYLQVQNGCNHRCTFCTIPYGRGNSRSMPIGEVVKQAKLLVESGYNELVLTGVDMTDYGLDLPGSPLLGEMVWRLLKNIPALKRLRLSSIDVAEVDEMLLDLIKHEPRLMPYMHLSLQSGDNMILKRMKRRHNREQVIDFCQNVRAARPDIAFGADIIAGFPTETEEMFQNTYNIIAEAGLVHLHIFPYSAHEGTPAAKMPQVPMNIRKTRANALRQRGDEELSLHLNRLVGKPLSAIIEENSMARAPDFSQIRLSPNMAPSLQIGSIVEITPTAISECGKLLIA